MSKDERDLLNAIAHSEKWSKMTAPRRLNFPQKEIPPEMLQTNTDEAFSRSMTDMLIQDLPLNFNIEEFYFDLVTSEEELDRNFKRARFN